jgi:FixJ family two-component response regulator
LAALPIFAAVAATIGIALLIKPPHLVSIVDDDDSVREATSGLLESHGYVTAAFASAEEFLQSGQLEDTKCLVTDLRMPGASGIELQQRLIDAGRHIPTIVVTAHPEAHLRSAVMKLGALAFLAKPVSEQRLILCLEGALANAQAAGSP